MAVKSVRLSVGSIFPKGPGKIYFYRYQVDGHRKTVSLQTTNRAEALRNHKLIKVLRGWTTPEILLNQAIQEFSNDLNSWEDKYGNSFFWYLYGLPNPVSKNMVDHLPEELLCVFDQPNCYGISPEDLWLYYRKGIFLPENSRN